MTVRLPSGSKSRGWSSPPPIPRELRGSPAGCRARQLVAAPAANLSWRVGTEPPESADRDPVCQRQPAGAALTLPAHTEEQSVRRPPTRPADRPGPWGASGPGRYPQHGEDPALDPSPGVEPNPVPRPTAGSASSRTASCSNNCCAGRGPLSVMAAELRAPLSDVDRAARLTADRADTAWPCSARIPLAML